MPLRIAAPDGTGLDSAYNIIMMWIDCPYCMYQFPIGIRGAYQTERRNRAGGAIVRRRLAISSAKAVAMRDGGGRETCPHNVGFPAFSEIKEPDDFHARSARSVSASAPITGRLRYLHKGVLRFIALMKRHTTDAEDVVAVDPPDETAWRAKVESALAKTPLHGELTDRGHLSSCLVRVREAKCCRGSPRFEYHAPCCRWRRNGWMAGRAHLSGSGAARRSSTSPSRWSNSSKIPTIGVGEGTTAVFRALFQRFGFDELEFLRETEATIKFGIRHRDWRRVGVTYDGPIDDPHQILSPPPGAPSEYLNVYSVAAGRPVSEMHLFAHLMERRKSPYGRKPDGSLDPRRAVPLRLSFRPGAGRPLPQEEVERHRAGRWNRRRNREGTRRPATSPR